ncbi:hypothetical protein BDZ94DRAFT_1258254 [Collybia nuda]|uniref:Uncharacterized protein n=1 Tax=Collybia nuda TaxID=64659 RepID=A0A9P5Y7L7_9AGAR|nr:hypothetical protein BDZ94DRAFT_1258254 [Collybia nuda]
MCRKPSSHCPVSRVDESLINNSIKTYLSVYPDPTTASVAFAFFITFAFAGSDTVGSGFKDCNVTGGAAGAICASAVVGHVGGAGTSFRVVGCSWVPVVGALVIGGVGDAACAGASFRAMDPSWGLSVVGVVVERVSNDRSLVCVVAV